MSKNVKKCKSSRHTNLFLLESVWICWMLVTACGVSLHREGAARHKREGALSWSTRCLMIQWWFNDNDGSWTLGNGWIRVIREETSQAQLPFEATSFVRSLAESGSLQEEETYIICAVHRCVSVWMGVCVSWFLCFADNWDIEWLIHPGHSRPKSVYDV
jgi:hypothetical protein